jgi:RNA polymerase primary sigma factor
MDEIYRKHLSQYPPMTREEEKPLITSGQAGNKRDRDKVINSNLRYVIKVAKEYNNQGIEFDDLVAYGNLGLCKAFNKFDNKRGIKFYTYAVWWIRQSILQALAEENHLIKIPLYQRITKSTWENTKNKLERTLQREVSTYEIEEELGKTIDINTVYAYHLINLDRPNTDEDKKALVNLIADENAEDPESESDHESFLIELHDILSEFTDREQEIIKSYYGIDQERGLTLEEIGIELELTRERVRQIKLKILEKLSHSKRKNRLKHYLDIIKSDVLYDLSYSKQNKL